MTAINFPLPNGTEHPHWEMARERNKLHQPNAATISECIDDYDDDVSGRRPSLNHLLRASFSGVKEDDYL